MLQDSILMLDGSDADNLAIVRGTAFPTTTSPGELFFRSDEDKLYIRNAANDAWIDLSDVGSSSDTVTRRLQVDELDDAYVEERVWRASSQYSGFTTVATITPTGGVSAGTFTSGMVAARLSGLTSNVGVGARNVLWHFDYSAGVVSVGSMYDEQSNAAAPDFQLSSSGANILVQIQGGGGANPFTGIVHMTFNIPPPSGSATAWIISYP